MSAAEVYFGVEGGEDGGDAALFGNIWHFDRVWMYIISRLNMCFKEFTPIGASLQVASLQGLDKSKLNGEILGF